MNLKIMLERYPLLKNVIEDCLRMKAEGRSYSEIRSHFQMLSSQLYPNHKIPCPSRTSLWRLETLRKEQVMELHGWIRCPNCDKLITQEEALHNTIIFEGQELKLCSECRGKYVDRTVRGEGNLPVQEERDLDVGERPRKRMFDPRREDYGRY